ncbi:MAG: hypothetical protein Q9201_000447 [Fulgogasparrea decipioides]
MSSPYSPYSINEAAPPEWKTGEEAAAAAFIGMALLLVVEVNFEIFRTFKRRKGLYYWAFTVGSCACAFDAIGLTIKFFSNGTTYHIWPLYTLLASVGWAIFSVAQLLILYSRLHLVTESHRLRRGILLMIAIGSPMIIVPDWVAVWPAWNPDPQVTSEWSPRLAIIERYAQLGFDLMEVTISGIYIYRLRKFLLVKSSVRQRRVMLDLVYIFALVITLDITNVILVFLNRVGVSHPIQTFSYILKLRLEFVVLNQLVAVAAHGLKRETFEEKRYHASKTPNDVPTLDGPALRNVGSIHPSDCGDSSGGVTNESIRALPSLPADSFSASSYDLPRDQQSQKTSNWFPMRFNVFKNKKSGEERILPDAGKPQKEKGTLWRNDDDEPEEEDPTGVDMWERRDSKEMRVPWLRKSPLQ